MNKLIKKIKNLKEKKVARNALWIISEKIFQMIISLFVGIITARYLGPENYGTLHYGAALVALFSAIANLGLENIIIKEFVNRKDENGLILGTLLCFRVVSGLLSITCIMIYVSIFDSNDKLIFITTLLQSIALVFQSSELIDYWFQSKLKSKNVAIAKTIAYIGMSIYKIILLVLGKSVEWFAFASSFEYILILAILIIMYYKNGGQKLKFSWNLGKSILKQSYHFIISGLMIVLYTQMDKIMIGSSLDETQVGLYSAATAISTMWGFVPNAIINSLRPTIYENKKTNEELYQKRLGQLYAIVFWVGATFSIGITIFSKFIVNVLYGEAYDGAAQVLPIAVWGTNFAYIGSARNVWIVCEEKNKYSKKYVLWGTIVNLVLNIVLIAKMGIVGAAIATLIAQLIVVFIAPLFYREVRHSVKQIINGILLKGVK